MRFAAASTLVCIVAAGCATPVPDGPVAHTDLGLSEHGMFRGLVEGDQYRYATTAGPHVQVQLEVLDVVNVTSLGNQVMPSVPIAMWLDTGTGWRSPATIFLDPDTGRQVGMLSPCITEQGECVSVRSLDARWAGSPPPFRIGIDPGDPRVAEVVVAEWSRREAVPFSVSARDHCAAVQAPRIGGGHAGAAFAYRQYFDGIHCPGLPAPIEVTMEDVGRMELQEIVRGTGTRHGPWPLAAVTEDVLLERPDNLVFRPLKNGSVQDGRGTWHLFPLQEAIAESKRRDSGLQEFLARHSGAVLAHGMTTGRGQAEVLVVENEDVDRGLWFVAPGEPAGYHVEVTRRITTGNLTEYTILASEPWDARGPGPTGLAGRHLTFERPVQMAEALFGQDAKSTRVFSTVHAPDAGHPLESFILEVNTAGMEQRDGLWMNFQVSFESSTGNWAQLWGPEQLIRDMVPLDLVDHEPR